MREHPGQGVRKLRRGAVDAVHGQYCTCGRQRQ